MKIESWSYTNDTIKVTNRTDKPLYFAEETDPRYVSHIEWGLLDSDFSVHQIKKYSILSLSFRI